MVTNGRAIAAAAAALALLAAGCGNDTSPTPAQQPATTAVAPATTAEAAPEATTTAPEPDVFLEAVSEADEPAATTAVAEQPTTSTVSDEAPASTTVAETTEAVSEEAREEAIDAIIAVFDEAAGEGAPSFEECRLLSNGEVGELTPDQVSACMGPLAAVLEACNQLGCSELGLVPDPTADETTTTTTTSTTTTTTEPTTAEPSATTTTTERPSTTSTTTTSTTSTTTTSTTSTTTTTTTTVPEPSETVTLESGWVVFVEGYVPPRHPDAEAPSWERRTWVLGEKGDDTPRVSANVQRWIDWCGDYVGCAPLLWDMQWALDYLGADEVCVLKQYEERAARGSQPGVIDGYNNDGLTERFGWHRCATVIDPVQPDGRLLSEHGLTMAQRCRAVLPADTEFERWNRGSWVPLSDCDEWGGYWEDRYEWSTGTPACMKSARLAEQWMEHHYDMPLRFPLIRC